MSAEQARDTHPEGRSPRPLVHSAGNQTGRGRRDTTALAAVWPPVQAPGGAVAPAERSPVVALPRAEPPSAAAYPGPLPPGMGDEFWSARPVLEHLRRFARSRMVSPNALLVSVLARAIAAAPPGMVLPATIGGYGSLNLAAVMVGPSGFGKGAVEAAARDATNLKEVTELPVGSGEGIARTFEHDSTASPSPVIFTASEVDSLVAIAGRQGSTVLATFRSAITGEALGAANAQKHTRVLVPGHSYRACFLIGAQPEKAGPLIGDTAGTVQRLLWVGTTDPDAPEVRPNGPDKWDAQSNPEATADGCESWWQYVERLIKKNAKQDEPGRLVVGLPAEAVNAMLDAQRAKLRGTPGADPADGHALLTRAKVAAGLMLLDGRFRAIGRKDWELAGDVIADSDRVRADVKALLDQEKRADRRARADADADHEEHVSDRRLQRTKEKVLRFLTKARAGELARHELRGRLTPDERNHFELAIAELVADDQVTEIRVDRGFRYRLRSVTPRLR